MMKTSHFYSMPLAVWLLANLLLADAVAVAPVPSEVFAAATNGLPGLLAGIPNEMRATFGLAPGTAPGALSVGEPFPMYCITPAALQAYHDNATVAATVSKTSLYYVPVMWQGRMVLFLVVDKLQSGWAAVSLGYAGLAGEVEQLVEQWPRPAGYTPQLIMVYQAQAYFYHIPQKDAYNCTKIVLNTSGVPRASRTLGTLSNCVHSLMPALRDMQAGH